MYSNYLDPRQLISFKTLYLKGSFSAAARELGLTQSAISHSIRALETELGVTLIHRLNRKLQLTDAGERLLSNIEQIFKGMDNARQAVTLVSEWGKGRIRVGASAPNCQYILPTVLREFRECFPQANIIVEQGDSSDSLKKLEHGELDIALTLDPGSSVIFDFRSLFHDELSFIVSPRHPWAREGKVNYKSIYKETLIHYNRNSFTFSLIKNYFEAQGIDTLKTMELGSVEAIKELIKINYGIGILASWVVKLECELHTLVALPLGQKPIVRNWGIACLRGRTLNLLEETFSGLCQSVALNLISK